MRRNELRNASTFRPQRRTRLLSNLDNYFSFCRADERISLGEIFADRWRKSPPPFGLDLGLTSMLTEETAKGDEPERLGAGISIFHSAKYKFARCRRRLLRQLICSSGVNGRLPSAGHSGPKSKWSPSSREKQRQKPTFRDDCEFRVQIAQQRRVFTAAALLRAAAE